MSDSAAKLKLTAKGPTEQRLLDYLKENASAELIWKINTGKKTLAGALEYVTGEAKKQAEGASSICMDDDTVFGWMIHFFEEDEIKQPKTRQSTTVPSRVKKKAPVKEASTGQAEKSAGPLVLDLFSGEEVSAR